MQSANSQENDSICNKRQFLITKFKKLYKLKLYILETILTPILLLAIRVFMGNIFWKSGKLKLADGAERTTQLFEWEYIEAWKSNSTKTILGMDINFPVPSAEFAATMATYTEITMPILLIFGFMGRLGALILFGMAATIELFILPNTTEHYYWLLLLGTLMVMGPGKISIDYFIRKRFLTKVK